MASGIGHRAPRVAVQALERQAMQMRQVRVPTAAELQTAIARDGRL